MDLVVKHLQVIGQRRVGPGSYKAGDGLLHQFDWQRDRNKLGRTFAFFNVGAVREIARRSLNLLWDSNYKIDCLLEEGCPATPADQHKCLHPRAHLNGGEVHDPWPYNQPECYGELLHLLLSWQSWGWNVIQCEEDWKVLRKLPWYFERLRLHEKPTNGIWEQDTEIYLSTLIPVAAGLVAAKEAWIPIPHDALWHLMNRIANQAPNECDDRGADLAHLIAIAEYGHHTWLQDTLPLRTQRLMVERIEAELVGPRGVRRYYDDWYCACCDQAATWPLGDWYLAEIWLRWGYRDRADYYRDRGRYDAVFETSYMPESWCGNFDHQVHHNSPLLWAHAKAAQVEFLLG